MFLFSLLFVQPKIKKFIFLTIDNIFFYISDDLINTKLLITSRFNLLNCCLLLKYYKLKII